MQIFMRLFSVTLFLGLSTACTPQNFQMQGDSSSSFSSKVSNLIKKRQEAQIGSVSQSSIIGTIGGSSGTGSGDGSIGGQPQPSPNPTATVLPPPPAPQPTATVLPPKPSPSPTATVVPPPPAPQPTATVLPPTPVNGSCGSAKNQPAKTAPASNLCASGNAGSVGVTSSNYYWSCAGVNGGRASQCTIGRILDGECGSAHGQSFIFPPAGNLCAVGEATVVSSSSSGFLWSCRGVNGGGAVNCSGAISSVQPTDIPLWQRCSQKPMNDNWYDRYIEAHDPTNTVFEFRRTTDLKLICQVNSSAIGNLSEYGRADVISIDLTVLKQACGATLDRDGANDYRVFIQDKSRYRDLYNVPYTTENDNLLMRGADPTNDGSISGYHEDGSPQAPGFHMIRYNSKSSWCLAMPTTNETSRFKFIDCGDKVTSYLQTRTDARGNPLPSGIPGGYIEGSTYQTTWSYALSIIDSSSDVNHALDPNLVRVANRCEVLGSPLVVDTRDSVSEELPLTSVEKGIEFDLLGENSFPFAHAKKQTAWVKDPRIMFLVKPNAKGEVNGINEMFGNNTRGIDGKFAENGYLALAKYKQAPSDTSISEKNPVFKELRLWSDKNLDGKAQAGELLTLREMNIKEIKLGYEAKFVKEDSNGNQVRYRSQVVLTSHKTLPMYDVFFKFRSQSSSGLAGRGPLSQMSP